VHRLVTDGHQSRMCMRFSGWSWDSLCCQCICNLSTDEMGGESSFRSLTSSLVISSISELSESADESAEVVLSLKSPSSTSEMLSTSRGLKWFRVPDFAGFCGGFLVFFFLFSWASISCSKTIESVNRSICLA